MLRSELQVGNERERARLRNCLRGWPYLFCLGDFNILRYSAVDAA